MNWLRTKDFGVKMQDSSAEMRSRLCCVLMSWRSCGRLCTRWQRSYLCTILETLHPAAAGRDYKRLCVTCRMSLIGSNSVGKHISILLVYHFKKQCIVNHQPQMRSSTSTALPTTHSITINVTSPLHLPCFYYNGGNVKCICSSQNILMSPGLSNLSLCSHFHSFCFILWININTIFMQHAWDIHQECKAEESIQLPFSWFDSEGRDHK